MLWIITHLGHATLLSLAALLPIVNPIGSAAMFLSLTEGVPTSLRRALARQIGLNSFFLLVGSVLVGTYVLRLFGISIPAVQVGGGMVVLATGWSMLNRKEIGPKAEGQALAAADMSSSRAFYPLTMPITVGPGSISVAITLGANLQKGEFSAPVLVAHALLTPFIVGLLVFLCDRFAEPLARRVGETGTSVIVRLSAFLLLCIGVQIMWNGLSGLLKGMPR
jgi:multiple antibiotic resistance protein